MNQYPRLSNMSDDDFAAYTARVTAAMTHYHAYYNNDTYQAIQIALEFGALKPPLAGLAAAEIGYVPLERVEKA